MSHIIIDPHGDLTIDVVKYETYEAAEFVSRQPTSVTSFLVNKSTLVNCPTAWANNVNNVFKNMLYGGFREARQDVISLDGDNEAAMVVFLRVIHNIDVHLTLSEQHEVMWPLVAILDKYSISIAPFKKWFSNWYQHQGNAIHDIDVQEMLFPCWKFDHAEGFKAATHATVYNLERRVYEKNPTNYRHIRLPTRIIQQLNAARGRLRTILHRELFQNAVRDTYQGLAVECKKNCEFSFNRALYMTGAWPLEDSWLRESPNVVLSKLDTFNYINNEKCRCTKCKWCTRNYEEIVKRAKRVTLGLFDGLCMDCLEDSLPNGSLNQEDQRMDTGDEGEDNDEEFGIFDKRCRVRHGECAQYYSPMGRRQPD